MPDHSHTETYSLPELASVKAKHPQNIIFSYLNINSIRNKINDLNETIGGSVDILNISETKVDETFTESQFLLNRFSKPYRLDITSSSGGLLTYVNSNIPSKRLVDVVLPYDIQAIAIEISIRKRKWVLVSVYRPPTQNLEYFLDQISNLVDFYEGKYSNFLIMGDFNELVSSNGIKKLHDSALFRLSYLAPNLF